MEHTPLKTKISRYLFISLGATLSIVSLALLSAHSYLSQNLLEKQIREQADTIALGVKFATKGLMESSQPLLLERIIHNYATLPNVIQIEVISPTGTILTSSPNDERTKMFWNPARKKLQSQINTGIQKGLTLNIPVEQAGHSLFVQILPFAPSLSRTPDLFHEIIVVLDIEAIHQASLHNLYFSVGLSLTGILLVTGGTIFFLRQRILRPLQEIQSAIAKNSENNALTIPIIHPDEIGFLAKTLQQKFTESQTLTTELDQRVKKRTQELQNTQEFLQTLLDYLPVALFVKNASSEKFGQILFWNHTSEKIFGLSAEQVLGKDSYELYPKEQADFFDLKDRETITSKKLIDIPEEPINSVDRGIIYLHTIKVPLFDDHDHPQYLLCISEDITIRKQAEYDLIKLNQELELRVEERTQAVRESEARYRNLLDQASDAILIADIEGNIVETNQKAIQLLGYRESEIVQLKISDFHPPHEIDRAKIAFDEIIKNRAGKLLDTLILCKNGQTIPIDITGSLIEYDGQQYVQSIWRDMSEHKQVELEIQNSLNKERELNRLKTQFINVASHEFRTPLTVILGNTECIMKYYQKLSDEKKLENLQKILKSGLRLKDMIEDVLILSRINSDKISLKLESLDIEKFCHEIVEDIQSASENKNQISLSLMDYYKLGKKVYLDPKILYHILSNILNNAVKYSAKDSPIECSIELCQSEIIFKIIDCGIGIPPEDLINICESFHRASNVENIPGTGLGLNIVKRYIELHGGTLEIQSELNRGSTVTVKLARQLNQSNLVTDSQ